MLQVKSKKSIQFDKRYTHISSTSSFEISTVEIAPTSNFCPFHWHEEMEIVLVQAGECTFGIDGKFYQAKQGDIFVLAPFMIHKVTKNSLEGSDSDCVLKILVANLRGNQLSEFSPLLNARQTAPCIISSTDQNYGEIFDAFCALQNDSDLENSLASDFLKQILEVVQTQKLVGDERNTIANKRYYAVKKLLEHTRENYKSPINIAEIAEQCDFSEFYFMRLFKKFSGDTIVNYINKYRLHLAVKRLLSSTEDIAKIAESVGFHNTSYFNRQFKQLFKVTPKEFRK